MEAGQNPEIQKQIDNINKLLEWNFWFYWDQFIYDKYDSIYQDLWWDIIYNELNDEYSVIQNEEQKVLNSRYYLSLSSNFSTILKNFFNINNKDFNVWIFHIIFIILIWSLIIKRRQIYN